MKASNFAVLTLAAFFIPGTTAAGDPPKTGGLMMENLFVTMDRDGNGRVTRDELAEHTIVQFQAMDRDTDGDLEPEEFLAAWLGSFRKSIQRHFATLDADGSGVITEDELSRVMVLQFARFDRDWDGAVTLEELKASSSSGKPRS